MNAAKSNIICLFAVGLAFLSACAGEEQVAEIQAAPKLTAEQEILRVITEDKASAMAFSITPVSRFECQTISVDVLQKDKSDGFWIPVETVKAIFDVKNPAQRTAIKDQILYVPLEKPGTYAISNISCKPFVEDDQNQTVSWKSTIGTFNVEYGRLNYVGTIAQHQLSGAVFIYEVADESDRIRELISSKNPDLAQYFSVNLLAEQSIRNFDGRELSVNQVLENKYRSADFYRLYSMLIQKRDFVERKHEEIRDNFARIKWNSIDDAMQQLSYYANLTDHYQETVYKFEDVMSRSRDFDKLEGYFLLRIMLDRTSSFRNSCTFKKRYDAVNDPCAAASSSHLIAQGEVADYIAKTRVNVADSDAEADIKLQRSELQTRLYAASSNYLNYAERLQSPIFEDERAKVMGLNALMQAAQYDLDLFDAKRAFARYNISKEGQVYYLSVLQQIFELQKDVSDMYLMGFQNDEFDQRDEYRRKRSDLVSLIEYRKGLDAQLF